MSDDIRDDKGKPTSKALAELIVDALVDAGMVKRDDFASAVEVAIVEIDVRKAMGDY